MTKSKRFWATCGALVGNFWLFYVGMRNGQDLVSLGTGLVVANGPLIAYIVGETMRPSVKKETPK